MHYAPCERPLYKRRKTYVGLCGTDYGRPPRNGWVMKKILVAATLSALATSVALPAAAAVYVTTWSGTLVNGVDYTGEFGQFGRVLDGLAFTAVYTLDDSAPNAKLSISPGYSTITGGPNQGSPFTPLTADLTITGHVMHFGVGPNIYHEASNGDAKGVISGNYNDYQDEIFGGFRDNSIIRNEVTSTTSHFLTSSDPRMPFATSGAGLTFSGGFSINNNATGVGNERQRHAFSDFLTTRVETVLRPQGGAVPEPASWALLIGGFGMVGTLLRRRRATYAA